MRARRAENTARMHGRGGNAPGPVSAGGSAPLATVVSLPTARAARPGAQRRATPKPAASVPHPADIRHAAGRNKPASLVMSTVQAEIVAPTNDLRRANDGCT